MATRQIISKSINVASGAYIGKDGELWVDTVSNLLKISDGATPGGVVITTDGSAQGDAVAIGTNAGLISQGDFSVAIGYLAGEDTQGTRAVAIGQYAGDTSQGADAVAIGPAAGQTTQGTQAVAIGYYAGETSQGNEAVAIGKAAGTTTQGIRAVAIGYNAGAITQGIQAVAIGQLAGQTTQGTQAVAIGYLAGETSQAANSIVINATGLSLNNIVEDTFVVKPIRNATMTTILGYDVTTGEVTHNAAIPGYTNTADLKALVAASTDFADYQTRMAAL